MAESAALLADEVFPDVPLRQWVISFSFPLRFLFAAHPQAMGKVMGIVYRAISTHLIHKAGLQLSGGATGAVTLIQRFGSALNLNIHFHILFLDGVSGCCRPPARPPNTNMQRAPWRNFPIAFNTIDLPHCYTSGIADSRRLNSSFLYGDDGKGVSPLNQLCTC